MAAISVQDVAANVTFYLFGIVNWFLYLALGLASGTFFSSPTEKEQLEQAIARDRFWNLSKEPLSGFKHAFFPLRSGLKLHYISNCLGSSAKPNGNLIIFIHGFPDTCIMWRSLLKEPAIPYSSATLVCVDLPGYGGSDSFEKHDTSVLDAFVEFVVGMREKYNESGEKSTVIVGHDWGCVIAFRLAAEAPAIADRFIATNGPHIDLALTNKDRILHSSYKIFKQFQHSPRRNFSCLSKSIRALKPVLLQTVMFGYIFAFHLPAFAVRYLGTGGNLCFLRGGLKAAHGDHIDEFKAQESLASSLGPGVIEIDTKTPDGEGYGTTVSDRTGSAQGVFWQMTSYYRDGLAFDSWTKSLETIAELYNLEADNSSPTSPRRRSSSSASSALFSEHYKGSLRAPSTILWGEKDQAVMKSVCLDGIGDYLAKGSEVILLPRTGHWTPVEKESRPALARVIDLLGGNSKVTPLYVSKEVQQIYEGASLMVKK